MGKGAVPTPPATAARFTKLVAGAALAWSVGAGLGAADGSVVTPAAAPAVNDAVEARAAPLRVLPAALKLASDARSDRTSAVGSGGAVGEEMAAVSTRRPAVARTPAGRKALGSLCVVEVGRDEGGDEEDDNGVVDGDC